MATSTEEVSIAAGANLSHWNDNWLISIFKEILKRLKNSELVFFKSENLAKGLLADCHHLFPSLGGDLGAIAADHLQQRLMMLLTMEKG